MFTAVTFIGPDILSINNMGHAAAAQGDDC